jgi:hypothetical protein
MRIMYFCFIAAALMGITGMSLGIYMGIGQDFTLAPAHAHVNLLGWVTMMLYGLYHRGAPQDLRRVRWVQVVLGAVGAVLMAGGLAYYLQTGSDALFGLIVAGSLAAILAMALFLGLLIRDLRSLRPDTIWMHGAMSG